MSKTYYIIENLGMKTIYLHGALMKISEFYSEVGISLGRIQKAEKLPSELVSNLILCPPSH